MRANVKEVVKDWADRRGIPENTVEEALKIMLQEGKSRNAIAKELGVPVPTLSYWLRKYRLVEVKSNFPSKLREMGYNTLKQFFTDPRNVDKTFKELAEKTGFTYVTVSNHYQRFRQSMEEATDA